MQTNAYEIVVVGGGPAGYIAAIQAARLGARTALVEKSVLGGTCLNRGCIPTKTLLKTSELLHGLSQLKKRGIDVADAAFTVDMPRVVAHKNGVVKKLTNGVGMLMKSNGIDVYPHHGVIQADKTIALDDGRSLQAQKVIFAGGSKAARIHMEGIDAPAVITSDEILDLEALPARLAIIGGGVIGVEMATIFSAFGSKVTILEKMEHLLPGMDQDLAEQLEKVLKRKKITVLTGAQIVRIAQDGAIARIYYNGDETTIEADKILLSIGRVPDLSGLGQLPVALERGRVVVDDHMRTNLDWLWAPGDVNGRMMLAHAAFHMAEVAAKHAMGVQSAVFTGRNVPACVYTQPEIAGIGLTEQEAGQARSICTGKFLFAANGRAVASDESTGFVKVVADRETGEILGIHIVGPAAAELIQEAAVLMAMEITIHEVPQIVHAHPTFSEALMEAAADCLGNSLHLPPKA